MNAESLIIDQHIISHCEVCAYERGRAKDHALNALCRRSAALQLSLNVRRRRRYVETDRNASDGDSRLADRGLLQSGQILSGQRLVAQLAARGAHDDVARLRRQERPPLPPPPSQTHAHLSSSSDVSIFRPPPGLERPQDTDLVVTDIQTTSVPCERPRPSPIRRAAAPAVAPAAPVLTRANSTDCSAPLSQPSKKAAPRSVRRRGKAFIETFAGCARLTWACLSLG